MSEKKITTEDLAVRMRRSKRKVCAFCVDKAESIDYKDVTKIKKVCY